MTTPAGHVMYIHAGFDFDSSVECSCGEIIAESGDSLLLLSEVVALAEQHLAVN